MAKPAILTVDDDPAVLQSITRDLRSRFGDDYQIVRASSGADALKLLGDFATRGRQVALIASDQRMPEMNGVEFLREVRRRPEMARLPIVLTTSEAEGSELLAAAKRLGVSATVKKPWHPQQLRDLVDATCGHQP